MGWTTVDLITDFLSLLVAYRGAFPFFGATVTTVAVHHFFFAGQKLWHHGHIVYIREPLIKYSIAVYKNENIVKSYKIRLNSDRFFSFPRSFSAKRAQKS